MSILDAELEEPEEVICNECGNDLACAGYKKCLECLTEFGED